MGKLNCVIFMSKLTTRSSTETFVAASILIVPSAGLLAPVGVYATADQATISLWSVQLSTCG